MVERMGMMKMTGQMSKMMDQYSSMKEEANTRAGDSREGSSD